MTTFQILYWYDIPTQVRAKQGRQRSSKPLSSRFMDAVDRAAMRAGVTGSDAYMDGFKWSEAQEREGAPEEVAAAVALEIEAVYPEIDWKATSDRIKADATNGS